MPRPADVPIRSMAASRSRHQDATQAASASAPSSPSVTPSIVIGPERSVIAAPISTVRKHRAPTRAMARAVYRIGFARRCRRPCDVGFVPAPEWSLSGFSPPPVPGAIKNSIVYPDLEGKVRSWSQLYYPTVGRAGSGWQDKEPWTANNSTPDVSGGIEEGKTRRRVVQSLDGQNGIPWIRQHETRLSLGVRPRGVQGVAGGNTQARLKLLCASAWQELFCPPSQRVLTPPQPPISGVRSNLENSGLGMLASDNHSGCRISSLKASTSDLLHENSRHAYFLSNCSSCTRICFMNPSVVTTSQ